MQRTVLEDGSGSNGHSTTASLTSRIVEEIAAREGVDPLELPVVNDVVDVDALESLTAGADETGELEIRFTYCGYRVELRGDGSLEIDDE